MCGIVGVIHANPSQERLITAAAEVHEALYYLQHRGQDACGITTCTAMGRISHCKGSGMASKVFHDGEDIKKLPGFMGIGHLRYPTAGGSSGSDAQPMYVNAPYGITMSHNGNLINALELREFLDKTAHRHINTDSDSELMLNIYASELHETGKSRVNADDCFAALERTYARCQGAWACVSMIAGFGLIAFRDQNGIRPLLMGSRTSKSGDVDYMVASESVALDYFACDPSSIIDIQPGQAVIIEKGQTAPRFHQVVPKSQCRSAVDIFEHVYFSRPDSTIDGISVNASRRRMGAKLGARVKSLLGPQGLAELDIVIPIPETANVAAKTVGQALKKPVIDGFVRNRYIFRTFIMPAQSLRQTGVRRKLNAIRSDFKDKNVLLVDDSIVRGTTSKEIVLMAREAGAKKVIFASCAPPITHPHIYGIDLASTSELIAFHKSEAEIAKEIGADRVIYQTLEDLKAACAELSPKGPDGRDFEVGVFTGKYITPVSDGYLEHLEDVRGKMKKEKAQEKARHAVVNGIADADELAMAARGMSLNHSDEEIFQAKGNTAVRTSTEKDILNGSTDRNERAEGIERRDTQDVGLYNLNDHER